MQAVISVGTEPGGLADSGPWCNSLILEPREGVYKLPLVPGSSLGLFVAGNLDAGLWHI